MGCHRKFFLILFSLFLLLSSCRTFLPKNGLPTLTNPTSTQITFSPSLTPVASASPGRIPQPLPTNTTSPSPTSQHLPSSTPLPSLHACAVSDQSKTSIYLDENPAVKLRTGPGCEYPGFADTLAKPDPLSFFSVLGKKGDWWLVDVCRESPLWIFAPSIGNNIQGEAENIPAIADITPVSTVSATAALSAGPSGITAAGAILVRFFDHLNAREYEQAASIFGGGYGIVRMWNSDVNPQDFPTLLLRGCEWNGFYCSLKIKQTLEINQVSAMVYEIEVEFQKEDGTLYQLYSMADPNAPPRISFTYTVVQDCDGRFYVIDWPIFTG